MTGTGDATGPGGARAGGWSVDQPAGDLWRRVDLVLVRHARSVWNEEGLIQGHAGPGLSPEGHRQASDVATYLAERFPAPAVVASSDLSRAVETAAPYADRVAATIRRDARLREIDNGSWSGRTTAEVARSHPEDIAAIRRGDDIRRGGGERFSDVGIRVTAAVDDLVQEADVVPATSVHPVIIVFTHGGPVRAMVSRSMYLGPDGHRRLEPPVNGSVTRLSFLIDPAGGPRSVTLAVYNHDVLRSAGDGAMNADDVATDHGRTVPATSGRGSARGERRD